jgi:light-regulated signal transduction histidine kinase (bacteriophytochrome)
MRQIIFDLLEFSRVGKWEDRIGYVDTEKIVADTVRLYKKRVEEADAIITTKALPVVYSYMTPLTQVFQNLVSNALKYSRADVQPRIEIGCENLTHSWKFHVADNGIGFEADNYERIFIMFQRLHSKSEYSGTGIGLAIVKKIINNLGGAIWPESAPERGTTFYFTLPKNEAETPFMSKTLADV